MTTYRKLEVIASDLEHDGLMHVGVMLDGAFIPLAAVKAGSVEQRQNVPTALAVAEEDSPPSKK